MALIEDTGPSIRLADANNAFGVNLLKAIAADDNQVFISPFSISTAMAVVYHGARGISERELFDVLGYKASSFEGREDVFLEKRKFPQSPNLQSSNVTLDVANAVLVRKGFPVVASYKRDVEDTYQAVFKEVDFCNTYRDRVLSDINHWVSKKTKGKIGNVLSDLPEDTVLFILNAVYFKGYWKSKFVTSQTKKLPFYNHGHTLTDVDTMSQIGDFPFATSNDLSADVLELPYEGDDFSMVIMLPHERDGLHLLLTHITVSKIKDVASRVSPMLVNVRLPKFKLESNYSLVQHLKGLGSPSIFAENADLSGISECEQLLVSDVIHKAVVEVNEEGSEAAAFTGVRAMPKSLRPMLGRTVGFFVDHPFLFVIRSKEDNLILFAGVVNQL